MRSHLYFILSVAALSSSCATIVPDVELVTPVSGVPGVGAIAQQTKGPAMCMSSIDYARNETAIAQLCIKGKCTYEQQEALDRMKKFREEAEGSQK